MKTLSHIIVLLALMAVVCCKENVVPGCQSQEIKPVTTYEFMPMNAGVLLQNIDVTKDTINLVITNQTDYDFYIVIDPSLTRPVIDFKKQILLAGRIVDYSCGELERIDLTGTCTEYDCVIVIQDYDCLAVNKLTYFLLIDKTNAKLTYDYVREN
jgi:hypothetical protein